MRTVEVDGRPIDSGPTVLTMRRVFDDLFAAAGQSLDELVELVPLDILARHAWTDGSRLDLHADIDRNVEAIAALAGPADAEGYRRFIRHAAKIYDIVEQPFIEADSTGMLAAAWKAGPRAALRLLEVDWQRTLWKALQSFFVDPRLVQLFGRYATYYGSSPFRAPGTLALIAAVEQAGVWRIAGGMQQLARALQTAFESLGGQVVCDAEVARITVERRRATGVQLADGHRIEARAVVLNADPHALADGRFGEQVRSAVKLPGSAPRSLSAITVCAVTPTHGFPLEWHNVFFSDDYAAEFEQLFEQDCVPAEPTVYICAQDRDLSLREAGAPERLFILANAPAIGDRHDFSPEIDSCLQATKELLSRCGLQLPQLQTGTPSTVVTTPTEFASMFPATGGALYGPATHGAMAAFSRPAARSKMRGLYLVGGGIHPGAGVPMVALGGRAAAAHVLSDHPSMRRFPSAATSGGTSTRSATTARSR